AFETHPLVKEVRAGVGLLGAIEFHDRAVGAEVAGACIERGVLGRQLNDGALQVSPPFIITENEIATVGRAVEGALEAVASANVAA
ncbi:MAG TPA: aspartate aminotransferase family protein, partial [Solirubrobacter sp.]|nr:aspartate aminotransferase family protein [Solirubrobacter sp.]